MYERVGVCVCECECVRERDSTCEHVPGGQWDGLWEEAV